MLAPEVWPFGQAEPSGEGIRGMRMVLAKFRGRIHAKGMSELLTVAWELGFGILGEMEAGWDRELGEVGIRVSEFGDSVRKVPRVVTGESGIVLCGGMELRLLLELFTR